MNSLFIIGKEKKHKNKYQFRHTCFEQCPIDSKNYTNETGSYCNVSCPFERPFEIVKDQFKMIIVPVSFTVNELSYNYGEFPNPLEKYINLYIYSTIIILNLYCMFIHQCINKNWYIGII